ncbi:MAG: hypothetical protein ACK4F9_06265 [Brevinematia bacterium]
MEDRRNLKTLIEATKFGYKTYVFYTKNNDLFRINLILSNIYTEKKDDLFDIVVKCGIADIANPDFHEKYEFIDIKDLLNKKEEWLSTVNIESIESIDDNLHDAIEKEIREGVRYVNYRKLTENGLGFARAVLGE